jgi:4'-phosphopantetheinyl transferase
LTAQCLSLDAPAGHPEVTDLPTPITGVRLWLARLDGPAQHDAALWLSRTERERAARFVFARDADRYRAAHVLLRRLLKQHCGVPATEEFGIGGHDKPHLLPGNPWGFNLSHSGEFALIGIGPGDGIGVDVEVQRSVDDVWPLAEQNFSASEYRELQRTAKADVSGAFLSGWTRKEACLKAVGSGLSINPASFAVGLAPEPKDLVLETDSGSVGVRVHSVQAGPHALAAVARTIRRPIDQECP